ncbi:MAG: transcription elongation factor GreAB [Deltaproteobacteria bacterium]|nr:transcription elongation factor GreAB [Deltaproteobacteria bacterium]
MDKNKLIQLIIERLESDLELSMSAAKIAHEASTNDETQPDNKYDTLSLESSYIAQGHANRAQQLRRSIDNYKNLFVRDFSNQQHVAMTALVGIEYEDKTTRQLFIGPDSGGLKVFFDQYEIFVVTMESPLCKALLGKQLGDIITLGRENDQEFEIVSIY